MKHKYIFFISILLVVLTFGLYLATSHASTQNKLSIRVVPSKQVLRLGEIFEADLVIDNKGSSPILLHGTDVKSGYVKMLISRDGKQYKSYMYPGIISEGQFKLLKPNESLTAKQIVLGNAIPRIGQLSETDQRQLTDKRLDTVYAFQEAANYYVKAALYVPMAPVDKQTDKQPNEKSVKVYESEPIEISVVAPSGTDKEVWGKIKDRSDIAYFMQDGDFTEGQGKKQPFLLEIEELLTTYPNSLYASVLQQSLDKFRENETKRLEYLKTIKKDN